MIDPLTVGHVRVLEGALKGMGQRPTPLSAELTHKSQWETESKIADTNQLLQLLDADDVNSPSTHSREARPRVGLRGRW